MKHTFVRTAATFLIVSIVGGGVFAALGCSGNSAGESCGQGTHAVGANCVADVAGVSDSGIVDSAPPTGSGNGPTIQPGDFLTVASSVNGVPGLDTCFVVTLNHADGGVDHLDPAAGVTVTVSNATFAKPTQAGDCSTSTGIFSIAAGDSPIQVQYTSNGQTLSAPSNLVVLADTYKIALELPPSGPTIAPVSGVTEVPGTTISIYNNLGVLTNLEGFFSYPSRLTTVAVADTAFATIAASTDGWYEFHGVSAGQTTFSVSYASTTLTAPLEVVPPGTFSRPYGVHYDGQASVGSCDDLHYLGYFDVTLEAGVTSYSQEITSGVTWSLSTAGVASLANTSGSGSPQVCFAAKGWNVIKGCYDGACAYVGAVTYVQADVTSLSVQVNDPSPVALSLVDTPVCPTLRASLSLTGGTTADVTFSPSLTLQGAVPNSISPTGMVTMRPIVNADGTTEQDGSGNPCYTTLIPGASDNATQTATMTVGATFVLGDGSSVFKSFPLSISVP